MVHLYGHFIFGTTQMKLNNKINKVLYCGLTLFMLSCTNSAYALPKTTSSIVIDAETGAVISANNADERRYPASLTKLMTLYLTFSALDNGTLRLNDNIKISRQAANRPPSRLGLTPGKTIRVKDAVMALIVQSANDCASVLAEALGGSETEFAKLMTKTAKDLGMKHTTFRNASGLPNSEQKTTARDMAILGSAVYHHFPQYYAWFSTTKFTYGGRTYYTHNHILNSFKGADGMKTGFTNAAGYNIVTSAVRNNRRVIAVTMGHNSIKNRDYKVAQLMNSGLTKLNKSGNVTSAPTLMAKIEIPSLEEETFTAAEHNYAVQIGAFSNYAKARNYAMDIRSSLRLASVQKSEINVEPTSKGAAVVYRSQLTGFAKPEADKVCNRLKQDNKSCIVFASTTSKQMAMITHDRH
jgi:D-alanyl-D-alanine carboxypeptidase